MIKAVIIGFSHMHVNEVALYIKEQEDFELCAAAEAPSSLDEIPPLRYTPKWNMQNVKENYCSDIYDDYRQMLEEVKPDIAFILAENCQKVEIAEECAKRSVNIVIEKPIATSLAEAKRIEESVKKYGIEAYINWPVAYRPYLYKFKAAAESGIVGEPIKLRYINGHTGPLGKGAKHRGVAAKAEEMTDEMRAKTWWHKKSHGGGVFLDIACYGCYFSQWIFGKGDSAIACGENLNTPFGDTDDNFAAVIRYNGKMSVIEGTWTTPRAVIPSGPMLLCTDGVIVCTGGAENAPDVEVYDIYGNKLEVPDVEPGTEFKNMPEMYAHHIKTGAPVYPMLTLSENMKIMAMLDAAMKSAKSGKEEKISE